MKGLAIVMVVCLALFAAFGIASNNHDSAWLKDTAAPGDYTLRSAPGSIVVRKYRDGGLADVTDPLRPVQFGFGGFEGAKWVEVER